MCNCNDNILTTEYNIIFCRLLNLHVNKLINYVSYTLRILREFEMDIVILCDIRLLSVLVQKHFIQKSASDIL